MGTFIVLSTSVLALLIATVPIGDYARTHLENRFPAPAQLPDQIDGIIVLGGAVHPGLSSDRQQLILQGNSERLFAFANLAKRYPEAKLVYTGGSNSINQPHLKEAHFAKEALVELGIADERVIYEDQSRNTVENATFSKALVTPKTGENWILITSAQHMPRSIGCFRKENWAVISYPVDYNKPKNGSLSPTFNLAGNSSSISIAAHEFVGMFAYWLTEKIDNLYPASGE